MSVNISEIMLPQKVECLSKNRKEKNYSKETFKEKFVSHK